MKRIEAIENARAKAMTMGLPLRMEKPGGGVKELIDFEGDQPPYLETKNADAAISTTANLVRTSPYMLDGNREQTFAGYIIDCGRNKGRVATGCNFASGFLFGSSRGFPRLPAFEF